MAKSVEVPTVRQEAVRGLSAKAFGQWLLVLVLLLTGYGFFAEHADFHLIVLRVPASSRLAHRLIECSVLWTIFWFVTGWILTVKKRMWDHITWSWTIALVPFIGGLFSSAAHAWVNFFSGERPRTSAPFAWVEYAVTMTPFVGGIMLGLLLLIQARIWRALGRAGRFCKCGYSLVGNMSGTCPECGTAIKTQAPQLGNQP